MTLGTVLYVSTSTLGRAEADVEISAIVSTSIAHNREWGVTGALLFSGTHFAQVLEGSEGEVARLLTAIESDPRHRELRVVDHRPIATRRFPDWGLAYSGPSQFVSKHIARLLDTPRRSEQARAADWLRDLLLEFRKS